MARIVTLQEQAKAVEARIKAAGPVSVPANKGGKRTASKRALLRVIAAEAERQARKPAFAAAI